MKTRRVLIGLFYLVWLGLFTPALAKDGDSGSGGGDSGSDNSGPGNNNSDDNDNDNDDNDSDKDDDKDDDRSDRDRIRDAVSRGEIAPLRDIIKLALAHSKGKVIAVKLHQRRTQYIYRISILGRDGRKRVVHINASTRKIVKAL